MRDYWNILLAAVCLTATLAGTATAEASQSEPQFQTDFYSELYEAHAQCDEDLDQTRSEFIVDMFERYRGNKVSKELMTKLLLHNIRIARMDLTETRKEREQNVSNLKDLETGSEHEPDSNDRDRERQKRLKSLDERIVTKQRYIEFNLCVLSVLQ